ncbi:MAG: hypothetical protein WAO98_09590, partial [Alphaproteobacteria bacterium]
VVGIAAIGGLGAFIMSSLIKGDIRIMMMVIAVLALGGCIYVGLKFSLVGTMVLCGVSSPIKSSWRMTDNQWWRIVWGHLCMVSVVWLILIAVFLIPVIVLVSVAEPQSALFVQGLSIVLGFSQATVLAAGSVYLCTTFRVLHQEQGLPVLRESGSM